MVPNDRLEGGGLPAKIRIMDLTQNQKLEALKLSGPAVRVALGGICLRKSRRDASGTKGVYARRYG